MKGAAQRWIAVGLVVMAAAAARAADVSNKDRLSLNFTREAANVDAGTLRLEAKGALVWNQGDPKLNMAGFPLPRNSASLTGGTVALLGSYGITDWAEGGFQITGVWQSLQRKEGGPYENTADVGDFLLYFKAGRPLGDLVNLPENLDEAEQAVQVGAGFELTMPNGPTSKGAGSGSFGGNPFLSTRISQGPWALMGHAGYFVYTVDAPDTFNYDVSGILRVTDRWGLRAEWSGRVFKSGQTIWDAVFLPGIDYNFSERVTIRPSGMVGNTKYAPSYGLGLGIAAVF